jgi:hypothetical protein
MWYLFTLRPQERAPVTTIRARHGDEDCQEVSTSLTRSRVSRYFEQVCCLAHAICRRLPTARAQVQSLVKSCWICGWQSGTEPGFLWMLRFPLPILIPLNAPNCWYDRPIMSSGLRIKWIQSRPNSRNKKGPTLLGNYWRRHGHQILICCSILLQRRIFLISRRQRVIHHHLLLMTEALKSPSIQN